MKDPAMGPRARKVIDDFMKNPPDPELMKRGASDIRAVAHVLLRTARRLEEGKYEAVSEMLTEPLVMSWAAKVMTTKVLAHSLAEKIVRADAEDN